MERFWPTFERRPAGMALKDLANKYNDLLHTGLWRNTAIEDVIVPLTPNQAYNSLPH
jgi:hypothetical protein